jgi:biotin operon repressor
MTSHSNRGDGLADSLEINVDDFRFSQVPEDLSFDPEVRLQSKGIFGGLQRYGASSGDRRVSYQTIGERMGVSRDTIKRGVHDLVEHGWAIIEERPGKSNRIRLLRSKLPPTRSNDDPGQECPDTQGRNAPGTQGRDAPRPIASNREQMTESSPSSSSATSRARGPADDDRPDDRAQPALNLITELLGRPPTETERSGVTRALNRGWWIGEINRRLHHAAGAERPVGYVATVLHELGQTGPHRPPATSPPPPAPTRPRPATPALDRDPDREYWARAAQETAPLAAVDDIGIPLLPGEGWDRPDVVKTGLAEARAKLSRQDT